MVPKQVHPEHYHIKKKESFQILWGDLELTLNSVKMQLKPGDIVTIDKMEKHSISIYQKTRSNFYLKTLWKLYWKVLGLK